MKWLRSADGAVTVTRNPSREFSCHINYSKDSVWLYIVLSHHIMESESKVHFKNLTVCFSSAPLYYLLPATIHLAGLIFMQIKTMLLSSKPRCPEWSHQQTHIIIMVLNKTQIFSGKNPRVPPKHNQLLLARVQIKCICSFCFSVATLLTTWWKETEGEHSFLQDSPEKINQP